jgi:hypothetical protein
MTGPADQGQVALKKLPAVKTLATNHAGRVVRMALRNEDMEF